MFNMHDWRARHRQTARTLSIAVASAALAGSGAAIAAEGGGSPSPDKAHDPGVGCAKPLGPAAGDAGKPGPADDQIVTQARTGLQGLVSDRTITQAEADAVLEQVAAGTVRPDELVRAGTVTAAHVDAINMVLRAVKEAAIGAKDDQAAASSVTARSKATAARRARARAAAAAR
jgi:hypothetical protein